MRAKVNVRIEDIWVTNATQLEHFRRVQSAGRYNYVLGGLTVFVNMGEHYAEIN